MHLRFATLRSFFYYRLKQSAQLFIAFLLLISNPGKAQTEDTELITINMRNAEISAVIQWVAEQTKKQIVIDPRVKGKVTVLANEPMTTEQAYNVFLAMLNVYGYSATESNGVLRIFPGSFAKTSPKEMVQSYSNLKGGEQVMYVYQVSNVSATRLVQLLQPLIPTTGYINAYPANNTLLMAGEADGIKRLIDMVKKIDASGDMAIGIIKLQHADANHLAGLITSLMGNNSDTQFSVVGDQQSNSLLMSGNPSTRDQVEQLVKQLDQPIGTAGNTQVVYLHYLDAAELVPILQGVTGSMQAESGNNANPQSVNISASESANAIVITAPPAVIATLRDIIEQVDIRRAQVLVEAVIVEVSKDFSKNLGIEWNTSLSNSDGTEAITNFGLKNINSDGDLIVGGGLNLGFYRNGSLRALAQTLANESDTNILSTPSLLTLDNQEAEILVGSNVPFLTGQSTGSASTTNNPFTTIERQDIGLTLKVTPQVNEGDAITLDILQEIETIAESATVANDIITNKRSIKTKVIVEDETILVLGGLVSDDVQVSERKVPLLGDIPVLGNLFKNKTDTLVKRNLMVFIHPVIIDSEEVAKNISEKRYSLMRELQEKYNRGKFKQTDTALKDFTEYQPREE